MTAFRLGKFLFRQKSALVGFAVVMFICALAIGAPLVAPRDPYSTDLASRLKPPSSEHLLGTDSLGRDILSRIIYGSRISLQVGVVSVSIAATVGTSIGLLAGFMRGLLESVAMRLMDILLTIPPLLLALALIAGLGPSLTNAMIAISVTSIPVFARLSRGQALSISSLQYVDAARALGARASRIVIKHILPNALAPIIVLASLRLATAILVEASLSFLGLGVPPPTASWGSMLAESRRFLLVAPWIPISPGVAILVLVIGLNLLGDGLRDAMDPRLQRLDKS